MSLAIVLMSWVAASLVLSPLLGRFMSLQDEGDSRTGPRQLSCRSPVPARVQQSVHLGLRGNAAIAQPRRNARWPRVG